MADTYQSIYEFKAMHNVAEDLHSTETVSTSDSKSYGTTFSQRKPHLSLYSPYHTTPSHSRSSSHDLDQRQKMNVDLFGIGHLTESPTPEGCITASPPAEQDLSKKNSSQQDQHIPSENAVAYHHPSPLASTSAADFQSNEGDTAMVDQEGPIPTPDRSHSSTRSPNLSIIGIGTGLTDSLSPGTPSFDEYLSSSDASSEDEDLDLERSADEALSRWFGISINRLVGPFRVIYAFEQVKQECAGILQDEGHYRPDDDDDDESQGDLYDAGESSRSTPSSRPCANKTGSSRFGNKKRLGNRVSKAGSSPGSYVKVRGRNKKHRSERELSCPYRKRNPNRFNVRDHEQCANKSYSTMSDVKYAFHLFSLVSQSLVFEGAQSPGISNMLSPPISSETSATFICPALTDQ